MTQRPNDEQCFPLAPWEQALQFASRPVPAASYSWHEEGRSKAVLTVLPRAPRTRDELLVPWQGQAANSIQQPPRSDSACCCFLRGLGKLRPRWWINTAKEAELLSTWSFQFVDLLHSWKFSFFFFFSGIKVKKLGFLSTEIQNAKLAAITAVLQYNDEIFYRNYFCFIYALITDSWWLWTRI